MRAPVHNQPAVPFRKIPITHAKPVVRDFCRPSARRPDGSVPDLYIPLGAESDMSGLLDKLVMTRIRLRKGVTLFRAGDRFTALYRIRSGTCKTVLFSEGARNQVSGYHIPGDMLGITGLGTDSHDCDAVALEDTEVCVVPFDRIDELSLENPRFQHHFLCLLSREITCRQNLMLMLGTMRAEQKLATFFLDLSQRYQTLGYSSCEFVLRMTREEIGSYLGLKLETVSRVCGRFQQRGLIQVQGRTVKLLDRVALKQLISVGT